SAMPVSMRGVGSMSPARVVSAITLPRRGLRWVTGPPPMPDPAAPSIRVCQAPHAPPPPAQRACVLPQLVQTYCVRVRAISACAVSFEPLWQPVALRHVEEAREFRLEAELDRAGGAVALLGDDDLGLAAHRVHLRLPAE